MKYRIVERANPLNRESSKYYCQPEYGTEINIRKLATEISKSCTLTTTDIIAVIESFLQNIPEHLKNGNRVRLDNFGIFKLSFGSKGQVLKDKVSAQDINTIKILFTPSSELRKEITNVTFERN